MLAGCPCESRPRCLEHLLEIGSVSSSVTQKPVMAWRRLPSSHRACALPCICATTSQRLITSGHTGVANVETTVLARLAQRFGTSPLIASGRRPLGRATLGAAIRQTLRDHARELAPVATHPSTESELISLYERLRHAPSAALDDLARLGRRETEVVRIMQRHARVVGAGHL